VGNKPFFLKSLQFLTCWEGGNTLNSSLVKVLQQKRKILTKGTWRVLYLTFMSGRQHYQMFIKVQPPNWVPWSQISHFTWFSLSPI